MLEDGTQDIVDMIQYCFDTMNRPDEKTISKYLRENGIRLSSDGLKNYINLALSGQMQGGLFDFEE